MKKLLVGIIGVCIISGSLLLSLGMSKTPSQDYTSVCRVTEVQYINNNYKTSIVNEDGEEWVILADQDLTNQWLDVYYHDMGTPNNTNDDQIYGFDILEN